MTVQSRGFVIVLILNPITWARNRCLPFPSQNLSGETPAWLRMKNGFIDR
jgi:hypothetical protein